MKTSQCVLLLVAGLVVGLCVGGIATGPIAHAQVTPIPASVQRFQIAAWSSGTGSYGCYITDTMTGQLWQSTGSGRPVKISEKLP